MIIGVDFDNTIVCYDEVFHRVAVERGLIPADTEKNKSNVRDYLRKIGKEDAWTELQGLVYGKYIKFAPAYEGVKEFFKLCKDRNVDVVIISHKTLFPFIGKPVNLHDSARKWLEDRGFYSQGAGLSQANVHFELTKEGKIKRIRDARCTYYIDDLPEFLAEPSFPESVKRILFDPHDIYEDSGVYERAGTWPEISGLIGIGGGK